MAYTAIQQSEINNGAIFDQSLLQKIKDNFDAHADDLSSKQVVLNSHAADLAAKEALLLSHTSSLNAQSIKISKQVPIGTVRSSTLSLTQYNAQTDGVWQLMDGGSCLNTAYATLTGNTTVPDALIEGTFLRQAKAGRTVGTYEADEFKAHNHGGGNHRHTLENSAMNPTDGGGYNNDGSDAGTAVTRTNLSGVIINTEGGDETRPKNLAVNFFIKVGY